MKSPSLSLLAGAALLLLAAGCGQPATPADDAPVGPVELVGTHWVLSELDGAEPLAGTTITAQFGSDQTIAGSAGCNQYTGGFTLTDGSLAVDENLATTMMACEDDVMTQETAFLKALVGAETIALTADELRLEGSDGQLLFAAQSQELAGTSWQVVSYNDGSGVVSILAGNTPALEFTASGTLSGDGGCNTLTGDYSSADGTLDIGTVASTQMACSEPEGVLEQETAIVQALESAIEYEISGDSLTLRNADGQTALLLTRV